MGRTTTKRRHHRRLAAAMLAGLILPLGWVAVAGPAHAAAPALSVDVSPGTQTVPETTATVHLAVTIRNSGDEPVRVTGVTADVGDPYPEPQSTTTCPVGSTLAPGASATCAVDVAQRSSPYTTQFGVTVTGTDATGVEVESRGSAEVKFTIVPGTIDGSITPSKTVVTSGETITYTLHVEVHAPTTRFTQIDAVSVDRLGSWTPPPPFGGRGDAHCYPGNHPPYPSDYTCTVTVTEEGEPGDVITTTMTATGEDQTITRQATVRIAGATTIRTAGQWADPSTTWPAQRFGRVRIERATRTTDVFDVPHRCRHDVPRRLDALLGSTDDGPGACGTATRLMRAATAAILNEAESADYPAESERSVRADTNAALCRGLRAQRRLAATYEEWNGEA